MNLDELFKEYLQAGVYLKGWSPKTPIIYQRAFASLKANLDSQDTAALSELTKGRLEAWIVSMRQKGRTPAGCNIYIRAINAFYSWLKQNGYVKEQVILQQVKCPSKTIKLLSSKEIETFLRNKPKRYVHQRTWLMILLMLDTGCRINEVLTLKKSGVDFDNLLLLVDGKGSKQRKVPFSGVLRKHLWLFLQKKTTSPYVFSVRCGLQVKYRNARRDITACFKKIGIEGKHIHPHNLRHTFACNYAKSQGSIIALSRILGHSSITTTEIYLRGLQIEDFKTEEGHISPVA